MKLNLLFIIGILASGSLFSQQLPNWSSYYEQGFIWNPALTAHWNKLEITGVHRQEWTGFDEAPQSTSIGVQYPFLQRITRVSIGGYLEQDQVGPYSKQSVGLTYSYRIIPRLFGNRSDQLRMGVGVQAGRFNYDPNRLVLYDGTASETTEVTEASNRMGGNIQTGLFYVSIDDFNEYKSHYYFGLAVNHVIPSKNISNITSLPHANLHFGYRHLRGKRAKSFVEPNVLLSYSFARAINAMISVRHEKRDAYWAAVGVVTNGDMFAQAGLILDDDSFLGFMLNDSVIRLGAKVDYNLGPISSYVGIGYEFFVAYMFELEK